MGVCKPLGCHSLWEFTDSAPKFSLSAREVKLWSASLAFYCVLALIFPDSGGVPAWCTAEGRGQQQERVEQVRARYEGLLRLFSVPQFPSTVGVIIHALLTSQVSHKNWSRAV